MRKLISVFYFLSCLTAFAQPSTEAIDTYVANAQKAWGVPGMSIAVVKDGEVVLAKGYGTLAVNSKKSVDEHTLFAIASNTKAFIASALGQLVARGSLRWDDKVIDYLPYFELYDPYATQDATIADLLCHRLGLGTFSGDLIWYKSDLSSEEIIQTARHVPQAYGFRDGYGYSNLMYIAAGEVIKKVTGKPWNEFLADSFFEPLEMDRTITSTHLLNDKGNYAFPHKPMEKKQQVLDWVNWDNVGAAGGIISSANDMAKWMILNLNRGVLADDTLLSPEQQNILWTPHNNHVVSLEAQRNIPGRHFSGYGLGWNLTDYYGNLLVTHSGGYDGMYSAVTLIPDQKLGIVVLTNTMKGISYAVSFWIADRYLGNDLRDWSAERLEASRKNDTQAEEIDDRLAKRSKKIAPTLDLASYTGTYHSELHGRVLVTEQNGQFKLRFANASALSATLTHWHYNIWQINWDETHAWFDFGTVQFLMDNNLNVDGLRFDVPNGDIFFDEVDLKKIK